MIKSNLKVINNLKVTNKKGISVVIGVLVLVAIVFVLVAIVYSVVLPMVEDNLAYSKACSVDILDKIEINSMHTCYTGDIIKISINIGDIEMDELLVSVSTATESGSIILSNVEDIKPNSGKQHVKNLLTEFTPSISGTPESIRVAPKINGKQCGEVDSLYSIPACD